MYFFSKTKNLTDYLKGIATYKELPLLYRIECCKNLEHDEGYPILNSILNEEKDIFSELPTPIRVETILFLMKSDKFMQESLEYFCDILSDQKIDHLYRYKTIQVLESLILWLV
jgi:hypothetical protein